MDSVKKIVWLVSYPKSGNTWFRVFLSNLLFKRENPADINDLPIGQMASSRILLDEYLGTSSAELTEEEIVELRPQVYRKLAISSDDLVFLKVHDAYSLTPGGRELYPSDVTKGVLYIIRNPLDVVVSFHFHSGKSIKQTIKDLNNTDFSLCHNDDKLFSQIKQPLSDWSGHVEGWLDHSNLPLQVTRYEDLLENPVEAFSKTLKFIGLNTSKEDITNAVRKSNLQVLSEMEANQGFREKPLGMSNFFRSGKSGDWNNYLQMNQIEEIISKHGETMDRFGYLPEK